MVSSSTIQVSDQQPVAPDSLSFGYLDPITYVFVIGFLAGAMFAKYVIEA